MFLPPYFVVLFFVPFSLFIHFPGPFGAQPLSSKPKQQPKVLLKPKTSTSKKRL
jgi:hypothetical protein